MSETIIKIDHVSKEYRLGAIGGGTLRGDLQSWWARVRGKDDPNLQIGKTAYTGNEKFLALDDISFEVKKGGAVGIIGHNGAGKSTLLKLLSRVTAPTKGTIGYNGRIASMLEVGTGFHPELTGRENVYMNGAILGMTKAEISRKFDQIVEFAEMEKFIDTPVKRYSSGMYVKLAFSVAAHLDSEIMIMDEVLAVGDMAFQKKCLGKMSEAAKTDGRTVLYVSHNMNTIRQLCDRCVVLDKGKVVFDGEVEDAISLYIGMKGTLTPKIEYAKEYHSNGKSQGKLNLLSMSIKNSDDMRFECGTAILAELKCRAEKEQDEVKLRFECQYQDGTKVGTMLTSEPIVVPAGKESTIQLCIHTAHLTPGKYNADIIAYTYDEFGNEDFLDGVYPGITFELTDEINEQNPLIWLHQYWGCVHLHDVEVC